MKQAFQNKVFDISIVDHIDEGPVTKRDPEIVYVMEGALTVLLRGKEHTLRVNDHIVINSDEEHRYIIQESGLFVLMRMRYSETADYLGLRNHDILCCSLQEDSSAQGRTGRILQNLISYYLSGEAADEAKLLAESYELLHRLREFNMVRKDEFAAAAGEDDDKRKELIRQFVNDNFRHKVTLTDLANITYLSPTYLSRYIKEKFGKTFSEVLMDVRITHAEKDIAQTTWPITRIAMENGFSLPSSFNKAFRQRYKMSPSAYRRMKQEKSSAEESAAVHAASEETLDRKIREFMSRGKQSFFTSASNVSELVAHANESKPLKRFWEVMINGGAVRDLMRADMQEHLLQLANGLNFTHVRIWDLYAPELMLFRGDGKGTLNFSRIDGVLDFLHRNKIKPYIELGAKPLILMRNVGDHLLYEERKPLFFSPDEYGVFLEQFVTHCVNRYGIEEVEQWYFEQWMDTRIEDAELYLDVFDAVYKRLKAISPNIRAGGPGLSMESALRMPELLAGWSRRECRPDFISIYAFPYLTPEEHARQEPQVTERVQGSNYVNLLLDRNRQLMRDNGFLTQKLHLSEWNFTVSSRNFINDSVFKGAYIIKNILAMTGRVDVAGYWFASDLFSEFYDSEHLLNGSGGLITKDRICKPAYYGMYFLSRLERYLLAYNEDGMITANGRGSYTIVCHNYKHPGYHYYREREGNISAQQCAGFFDDDIKEVSFEIRGVKNGTYQIKTRMVDEENGSVLNEWELMGYTDELTADDVDYLRQICVPRIKVETADVKDGVLRLRSSLKANAIALIHVYHIIKDQ